MAVVDLGAGTTDVCIYQDGIVRYVGVIPMGSDSINKDIRSYGIMKGTSRSSRPNTGSAVSASADAEKLIRFRGVPRTTIRRYRFRNLASIIEARMMDIVDYVLQEIQKSRNTRVN